MHGSCDGKPNLQQRTAIQIWTGCGPHYRAYALAKPFHVSLVIKIPNCTDANDCCRSTSCSRRQGQGECLRMLFTCTKPAYAFVATGAFLLQKYLARNINFHFFCEHHGKGRKKRAVWIAARHWIDSHTLCMSFSLREINSKPVWLCGMIPHQVALSVWNHPLPPAWRPKELGSIWMLPAVTS